MLVMNDYFTHLTENELQIWMNEIMISAVCISCLNDILQHHSQSYADVKFKTFVKKELHSSDSAQDMNSLYCISETSLTLFWAAVLCLFWLHTAYKDLFLIVFRHNLKLYTKCDTVSETQTDFLTYLNSCFCLTDKYMPPANCWLDVRLKNISLAELSQRFTLICKIFCTIKWADHFHCSVTEERFWTQCCQFSWVMTWDAFTMSVTLNESNAWRCHSEVTYNKIYNLHKNLFVTQLKDLNMFELQQLKSLDYSQKMLICWYKLNKSDDQSVYLNKWDYLLTFYLHIKWRLMIAFTDTVNISFRMQQKYCIYMRLYCIMNFNDSPCDRDMLLKSVSEEHKLYWILTTEEVNQFIVTDMNWWIICLETLMCQVNTELKELLSALQEQQLINEIMIDAVIHTLHLNFDRTVLGMQQALWWATFCLRKREQLLTDYKKDAETAQSYQLELNYCSSLKKYELI